MLWLTEAQALSHPKHCWKHTINPCCFWVPKMYRLPSAGSERKAVLWGRGEQGRVRHMLPGFMMTLCPSVFPTISSPPLREASQCSRNKSLPLLPTCPCPPSHQTPSRQLQLPHLPDAPSFKDHRSTYSVTYIGPWMMGSVGTGTQSMSHLLQTPR